jgi:hypothetical protein
VVGIFSFRLHKFGATGVEFDEIENNSNMCNNQILSADYRKIRARGGVGVGC